MKTEKDQTDTATITTRIQRSKFNHRSAGEKLSPAEASELVNRSVDLMACLEVVDLMRCYGLLEAEMERAFASGVSFSVSDSLHELHERNCLVDAFEGLKAAMQRMGIYEELKPAMQSMGIYYPYTWNQLVEGADAETTAELAEWARRDAEVAANDEPF
jgi:hypothetical protein